VKGVVRFGGEKVVVYSKREMGRRGVQSVWAGGGRSELFITRRGGKKGALVIGGDVEIDVAGIWEKSCGGGVRPIQACGAEKPGDYIGS